MAKQPRLVHQLDRDAIVFDEELKAPQIRETISHAVTSANCFSVSNILSHEERLRLIAETNRIGYGSLAGEYEKKYRNNTRVLVRSPYLAGKLYERIIKFIKRSDIENAHPYGFGNAGVWKPIGLNDVFKFSCYVERESFAPHYDGCFVVSNEIRSIFTLLIYLNDSYTGGATVIKRRYTPNSSSREPYVANTKEIQPKAGMAVVFNHDVFHGGAPVETGVKYVVKTEIIFQRTDWSAFPQELNAYKNDPLYHEAKKLYAFSAELEKKGDVAHATAVYLQALNIQVQFKTYPSQLAPDDTTTCFSADVFATIFNYVDIKTVVKCSSVSKRWLIAVKDGLIWYRLFKSHFPSSLFTIESKLSRPQKEDKAFLKDWYSIFKECHLLAHSWHQPICVDIGSFEFKYALSGFAKIHREATIVGREIHPHYIVVGGGIVDIWCAGKEAEYGGNVIQVFRPYTRRQVHDWYGLWVVMRRVFRGVADDTRIEEDRNPHMRPIVLAEGPVKFDRAKLFHLMFDQLEVPALCVVDSAVLALHAIERTTGVVIDCSKEGVVCTPVWNGEVLKENRRIYGLGGRHIVEWLNHNLEDPLTYQKYETMAEMCKVVHSKDDLDNPKFHLKDCPNNQHLKAPEILFDFSAAASATLNAKPNLAPINVHVGSSVVDFVYNTVLECEESKRNELFNCLFPCGGLASMEGFLPRFKQDMKAKRSEINIINYPTFHANATINGALNFCSSTAFLSQSINRLDYLANKQQYTGHASEEDLTNESQSHIVETEVAGGLLQKFQKLFGV